MAVYVLNSPILTSYGRYSFRPLEVEEAKQILSSQPFVSAVGHKSTADFMSALLGVPIPVNRVRVTMQKGDKAIVFRVLRRLPEGFVATEEELRSIPWELGLLTREE